jgi:uncharacterized protein YbaP (TraB family)
MLNRLVWTLFALSLAVFDVAAETCPPPVTAPAQEAVREAMGKARDHGFLWRISKDGHVSYLYGTIHVARFEWMFPGPQVMRALGESDTIALELDLMDPDIRNRMTQGMAGKSAPPLSPAQQKRMRRQAEAACVPYSSIAGLSAEMQITMLTVMAARADGLEAAYAIDTVLAGIGHGAHKEVVSLETPEAQLELLGPDGEGESESFVEESLSELEKGSSRRMIGRIATVWAGSDYAELERYNEWCECLDTSMERALMKKLLDERNPNLAARIDEIHRSGKRIFAAVGSLHMFGPFALPKLMEERGYRVERIDFR